MENTANKHLVFCTCRPKLLGKFLREYRETLSQSKTTFIVPEPTYQRSTAHFKDKIQQLGEIHQTKPGEIKWEKLNDSFQNKLLSTDWKTITVLQHASQNYKNIYNIYHKITSSASLQIFASKQIDIIFSNPSQFKRYKYYNSILEPLFRFTLTIVAIICFPVFKIHGLAQSKPDSTKFKKSEDEDLQLTKIKSNNLHAAICIVTCKRSKELSRLLKSIENINVPFDDSNLLILIADNDKELSAREIWENHSEETRFSTQYVSEPQPGIPFVRNRALNSLPQNIKNAIFVDDDEIVTENWLKELIRVQKKTDSDLVAGPAIYEFAKEPSKWLKNHQPLQRDRYITSTPLSKTRTSNLLLHKTVLSSKQRFAESYGLRGGSDIDFTTKLTQNGKKICWADQAVAKEILPPERCNIFWYFKRKFRNGSAKFNIYYGEKREARLSKFTTVYSKLLCKILFNQIPSKTLKFIGEFCEFLGKCWGLSGAKYQEYKNRH